MSATPFRFRGIDQRTGLTLYSILSIPLRVKQSVISVLRAMDTEIARFNSPDLASEPLNKWGFGQGGTNP